MNLLSNNINLDDSYDQHCDKRDTDEESSFNNLDERDQDEMKELEMNYFYEQSKLS